MTTPEIPETPANDPADPTPPVPEITPDEAAAQQAAAEKAAAEAALNDQIKALATEIAKQTLLEFDPATIRKGVVASLQTTGTPPTITVTISGDTLEVPGVRYYEHYSPAVADVVHLLKQGTDLTAIGKVAEQYTETAFTTVSLSGGFTHNGNGNGDLKVRRVWDHGAWKVQMQGGVNRSSGALVAVLDAKYRPTSATRRTVLAARDANGSNVIKIDIESSGAVNMIGGTTAPASATLANYDHTHGQHDHSIPNNDHAHTGTTSQATPSTSTHSHGNHEHGIPAVNAGASEHNHAGAVSTVSHSHPTHNHSGTTTVTQPNDSSHSHGAHEHGIDTVSHTHGGVTGAQTPDISSHAHGSHSHTVTDPGWISFNGVEYFL